MLHARGFDTATDKVYQHRATSVTYSIEGAPRVETEGLGLGHVTLRIYSAGIGHTF